MKVEQDSMLVWYPKIKNLPIPQPRTVMVLLTPEELDSVYEEAIPDSLIEKVKVVCDTIGYPCFVRTDLASAKHHWKDSCFVDGKTELWKHLYEIITFNLCAGVVGLNFVALAVREYIPMESWFTAFHGDMPVNPERRWFFDNHKVLCHHPYWIQEAIESSGKKPSLDGWKNLIEVINAEPERQISILKCYTEMVAEKFDGYWSVDYCKAKDGRWILIDMATGYNSWHPECVSKTMMVQKQVRIDFPGSGRRGD